MGLDRVYGNAYAYQERKGSRRTDMSHTTDSRALSVTGLEYYNLDALRRKGISQRSRIRVWSGRVAAIQATAGPSSLTMVS